MLNKTVRRQLILRHPNDLGNAVDSWLDDNQSLLAVTPLKLFRGQVSLGESQGYCAMDKAQLRQALS